MSEQSTPPAPFDREPDEQDLWDTGQPEPPPEPSDGTGGPPQPPQGLTAKARRRLPGWEIIIATGAAAALAIIIAVLFKLVDGGDVTAMLPADTDSAVIIDIEAIRSAHDRFPGHYQDFLDGMQDQLIHDLTTVEIDADSTDLYILLTIDDQPAGLTIAQGGIIPAYIADDWEDRGHTADSYRGQRVWDQAQARHTLFEDSDTVAASSATDPLNTLIRTARGDLPTLAEDEEADMYRLLEATGDSPAKAAVAGGPLQAICPAILQGCQGYAVAYESYDQETASMTLRAAVLFANPRRALKAIEDYDGAEQFLKSAVRLVADLTASDFGLLPAGTITIDEIRQEEDFLTAVITIDEREYGHNPPGTTPTATPIATEAPAATAETLALSYCDNMLRQELILQIRATGATRMGQVIRVIQQREQDCSVSNWNPALQTAPLAQTRSAWHPESPQNHCFAQSPNAAGVYTIDQIPVPESLLHDAATVKGSTQLVPVYQPTRDENGNIMIYFNTENPLADGSICWMYLSKDQLWVSAP